MAESSGMQFREGRLSIYHVLTFAVGAGVAITGALTGSAALLTPIATLIIGGAFGHAGQTKPNP